MAYELPVSVGEKVVELVRIAVTNPKELGPIFSRMWSHLKAEMEHYYLGFRLFFLECRTATSLVVRMAQGYELSRRERKQLVRTTGDVFRMVPFIVIIVVPFMEFLLPVIVSYFPGMLPSTFQSDLQQEERRKRMLKYRLELARYMQDTARDFGQQIAHRAEGETRETALELIRLLNRARQGEILESADLMKVAKLFKDEITLDNAPRAQLVAMSHFFRLNVFLPDPLLRLQLRSAVRDLKNDDQRLAWDGLENLTKAELQEACTLRGMRSTGLTVEGYRQQMQQWIDLSINKEVPASLLILSRAFTITAVRGDAARALQDQIADIDQGALSEAVLDLSGEQ